MARRYVTAWKTQPVPASDPAATGGLFRYVRDRRALMATSRTWHLTGRLRFELIRLKLLAKRIRARLKPAAALAEGTAPPMVSVVLSLSTATAEASRSIKAILAQTFPRFELILVGSGDRPAGWDQPQIRLIETAEDGDWLGAALNVARGHFLVVLEADQVTAPDYLERAVATLEAYMADVAIGPWRDAAGGLVLTPDVTPLLDVATAAALPPAAAVIRLDALRAVGGLKPELGSDQWTELWLRLAHAGIQFKPLSGPSFQGPSHLAAAPDVERSHELRQAARRLPVRRPRVAYLIPGKGISGGVAVICQHVNRLRRRGYDVLLLDTAEDDKSLDWFPRQEVPVIPFSQRPRYLDVAVATGWQTVHYLDLLDTQRRFYFVQSDETRFTDDPNLRAYIRETYTRPYEFFTEARWIQRWLWEEFGQVAGYTPNGLDPDIIHAADPLEPKGTRVRVLLEGPIDIPFKGMADAFAAVQDLDCEVWCVSSHGAPKPGWRCDRFFSAVPMTEMKHIYSSCDILLKMSRVEGFFGPPMEMMACGGAVVVSKVTGFDEYIVDEENALVVEPGDVTGARAALQRLIESPQLRSRLVAAGRQTAQAWRWEPCIDALETLLLGPEGAPNSNPSLNSTKGMKANAR